MTLFAVDLPSIVSDTDAEVYRNIFDLQSREEINAAIKLEKQLTDPILMNEVLYQRFISKTYRTHGKEIVDWMT